jgi:6-pyruvoyltetrahydropterin/6-carboxytetrahydropterin synthase
MSVTAQYNRAVYRVTVTVRFEAAHNLIDYPGGPEPLHGHSYRVDAVLENEKLQQYDLAIDFVAAKRALEAIAKELDYKYINEHPDFAGRNTSAENIARWFAERLDSSGELGWTRVAEVTVWEGPENRATYVPKA